MRTPFIFLSAAMVVVSAYSQNRPGDLVLVEGGVFKSTKSTRHKNASISTFYIGKCEVTQKEWIEVMGNNPSQFKGDNLPVETVSWYDCIEYCNQRSRKEGLKPYYNIGKNKKDPGNTNELDDVKWTVTINAGADGYRLPTDTEWEYAASGGRMSKSYAYSGGNDIDKVAWHWRNSGDKLLTGLWQWPVIEKNNCRTRPVGGKEPNELGLYDMSGNVREWCWEWYGDLDNSNSGSERERVWRGGGWMGVEFCCEPSFRGSHEANGKGPDQGFRVCRGK